MSKSIPLKAYIGSSKSLQKEGEEVRKCVEMSVVSDVLIAEFDAVLDVGIFVVLGSQLRQ